ncbi:hypothetical protein SERLA73DRAFT_149330 [Serpula lacrymans var. lacrymans S7.3]|uniref:Uncharacterized protein n=2 Tax=Serpula lacrymans var. lacrymans TaxID=341189 RepID=F8PHW8_SERL3|nr:uncharacterized protein SERLADRAFT_404830 [Serpula lacrymans var. lacrymans S7.9]EGO05064.1 hypothetical protein SERLA73DRAFT_149330 [Serpula lacrymans var. lacrymans S7.3]EGO30831.1 hypothetical protein SERLADRAFT_404830 [Serpula lacrymans var. lacrymans S7.9]
MEEKRKAANRPLLHTQCSSYQHHFDEDGYSGSPSDCRAREECMAHFVRAAELRQHPPSKFEDLLDQYDNCHYILDEAPTPSRMGRQRQRQPMPVSLNLRSRLPCWSTALHKGKGKARAEPKPMVEEIVHPYSSRAVVQYNKAVPVEAPPGDHYAEVLKDDNKWDKYFQRALPGLHIGGGMFVKRLDEGHMVLRRGLWEMKLAGRQGRPQAMPSSP